VKRPGGELVAALLSEIKFLKVGLKVNMNSQSAKLPKQAREC